MPFPDVFIVEDDSTDLGRMAEWVGAAGLNPRAYRSTRELLASCPDLGDGALVIDVCSRSGVDREAVPPGSGPAPGACEVAGSDSWIQGWPVPVLALTGRGDVRAAVRAMQQGATDVVEKPLDRDEFVSRLRRCLEHGARSDRGGEVLPSTAGDDSARADLASGDVAASVAKLIRLAAAPLTRRERQVLDLVADGLTSKAIGYELAISQKTVEKHRKHIMQRLEVDSLAELLRRYWTT